MPAPIITTAAFVWSLLPTGTSGHGFELPMVASKTLKKNPIEVEEVRIRQAMRTRRYQSQKRKEKKRKEKKGSRYVSHMHPMLQGGYMCSKTLFNSRTTGLYRSVPLLLLLRKTPLFHSKPSDRLPKSKGFDGESHRAVRAKTIAA